MGQHDVVPELWLVAPLENGCHGGTARTSPCPPALGASPCTFTEPRWELEGFWVAGRTSWEFLIPSEKGERAQNI